MRCPSCGAEMPEGSLYCEQCGEDIHIVPDFEPEVELNIEQTISGIAEDIKEEQEVSVQDIRPAAGRRKATLIAIIAGVLCLLFAAGAVQTYQYHSVSYQTEKAKKCVQKEQYDKAVKYYLRALELSGDDVTLMFGLAEVYFQRNNKIEYEYLLRQITKNENATNEQVESAYGKLIAIYRAREDYKSINELLQACENESVVQTYQNYVAMPPEFSIPEGYYSDIQPLKLTAYGNGRIYYTMDGSEPDENSAQYTAPIILDDGDYVICAYFVNEYGIASEYATKTYHIEIEALQIPTVTTVSGEYEFPTTIEISGNASEIYYTTDGSTPTISSALYTGPIPMPLGKSIFKFVRIDGGRSSEVVERTYSLVMNTEYTPEDAEKDVVAYSMESGKIYDEAGHAYDTYIYQYRYQFVTNISEVDDFYIISEFLQGEDGSLTRTGNHFAVNAYTGELFKLQIDEYNNYTLVEIEEQSEYD